MHATMPANERSAIGRLLNPASLAIAGISPSPGSLGRVVLENLERFGFGGTIHLVHPTRSEVSGRPCLPSLDQLPDAVDCVVLAVPVANILESVEACARRGVGGVVIFSAGFAEMGAEGEKLQARLAAVASAHGMAVEGPNCLGFINYVDGIPLTFSATEPARVTGPGVAVLSQSGAMAAAVRAALHGRGLEVTLSVSTGNEAVNGLEDFLEHALATGASKVISLVAEHIRDPRRFLALAFAAHRAGVVLVMLHPGRSKAGRQSAQTHTGALVGDYRLMQVPVERAGVLLVDTLEELIDLTELACRCPRRPHGGVAVMGESGAYKALTLDYCEDIGLALPQPRGLAAEQLATLAPGLILPTNPVDLTAQGLADPTLYGRAADALMADGDCGSLLVTIILSSPQMAARKMPPLIAALPDWASRFTTVFAMLGEDSPVGEGIIEAVRATGVPFFRSPERALRAVERFSVWAERPLATDGNEPKPAAPLRAGTISEYEAKDALESCGLPMPRRRLVHSLAEARDAAGAIGFPVALKLQSQDLTHKSNVGGVILGIAHQDELAARWAEMEAVAARHLAGLSNEGVLIERMAARGLELILGARNDPDWGTLISVGLGGVEAEALADVIFLAPDLTGSQIVASLRALRGAALLDTFRGRPARDVNAVADAVIKVGAFMRAHPEVEELDINPLVVLAAGEGVVALDALMIVRPNAANEPIPGKPDASVPEPVQ